MIITSDIHNLLDSTDHIVNWVNAQRRCVEQVERDFKSFYPKNYLNYITGDLSQYTVLGHPCRVNSVFYNPDDLIYHNKYIFNVCLYVNPYEPLTRDRIETTLYNLFNVVRQLNITALSLPVFNSYNIDLPLSEIIQIIESMVNTYIPSTLVTIYR